MSSFHTFNTAFACACSRFVVACGKSVAWLTAIMAITVTLIVLLRTLLGVGAIAAQEAVTYMHAVVIMVASAYTLKEGGHVRVDIFYQRFCSLRKAWVNALGTVFLLLPVAVFMVVISWEYVCASWAIGETSADAGGIPAVFLLKSLIIVNGVLLIIQALADLAQQLLTLTYSSPQQND